jgi:hypothetical protein
LQFIALTLRLLHSVHASRALVQLGFGGEWLAVDWPGRVDPVSLFSGEGSIAWQRRAKKLKKKTTARNNNLEEVNLNAKGRWQGQASSHCGQGGAVVNIFIPVL